MCKQEKKKEECCKDEKNCCCNGEKVAEFLRHLADFFEKKD